MSSEDSSEENNCIIVKPLSWRATRVDNFFQSLDDKGKDGKSPQSIRQMKRRIMGESSQRPKPVAGTGILSWAMS